MHKLLARQIAKATNEAGAVDLEKLFALITDAYADVDRDRRRTDRSMSLMIEEIDTVQRNLERTVIERTKELRERGNNLEAYLDRIVRDCAPADGPPRVVVFDLDGTLIDNRPRTCAILHEIAAAWRSTEP